MPKYKINDKVEVKVFNFVDNGYACLSGIIDSIDEITEPKEPEYVIYVPAIDDVICAQESDIILISEGKNE